MLDAVKAAPTDCRRCKSGRTWVQPPSSSDIANGSRAILFHCCGDGRKLTARIVASTEDAVVATWNSGAFDWIVWDNKKAP
jgi:hypothetical protein